MDQNSEPKDFSLEEYVAYAKKIALNPPAPMKDLEEEDEENAGDGEEDEEEDEESDGDENDDYWQHVVDRVVAIFKESKGRDPTEEELKVLLEQLNQGREAMEGDDDVDDEEETAEDADAQDDQGEAVDVSAMIRSKVTEALTEKLGRSPTEDELNEVLEEFSKDESLHSSLATQNAVSVETSKDTETAGASVDTGASETANASPEAPADLTAMIRLKLTEVLTMQLGRAPTEEELNEMMEGLSQDEEAFIHRCLLLKVLPLQRRHQQITRSVHLTLMENLLQLSSKTQVNVHGKKFHPILSLLLLNQPSAGHQDDCIIFNQIS